VIDIIALDADDTLWHSEVLYFDAQERFQQILSGYHQDGRAKQELYETETKNLPVFGYGIKGFALSMIETAIRLSDGQIRGTEIQEIIGLAREMLEAPVQLLDHVADAIAELSASHTLMVITKGDLLDQQRKLARSGLGPHFAYTEVVSAKTVDVYRSLLARYGVAPQRLLMVGNSLRSDILPVVALGGHAVHIPYHITWAHEAADEEREGAGGYVELEHMGLLPGYVEQLCRGQA
jgi:putative hydrolase of the HAD superfamily